MTRAQAKFITPVPRVDDTLLRCTIFPGRESEKVKTGLSVQRSHVSFRQLRTSPVAFGTTSLGFQCLGGEDLLDLAHKDVLDDVARFRVDRDPGPRGLSKAGRAPGRSLASHSFSFAVLRAKTSAATLRKPGGSGFQSNRCGRSSQNRRNAFVEIPCSRRCAATEMTDYHPLLAGAVSKLDTNTAEARQTLFERARAILIEQLRSRQPPATESEIMRERFALEDASAKSSRISLENRIS
jgi:hypothetical protein